MTGQSPAEAIFFAALEKGTPEERAASLDAACGDDRDLRARVERLLAAHPQIGSFMEQGASPAAAETATFVPDREQPGAVIAGRYKLLEQIGEGGMGTVWVAEQLEPIRRRVALKLVKPGMDSRAVLGRFEAERQALALMDHPNIAKVLDAGTTNDQRPYFVMELVKGTPITDFCDARRLSPHERLELFVPVCQAIQHAHTKGIIHRDIKPSNVLVALHDERPVPKVIDFGVAKAVGQQLTKKTLYTGFGALIGTPAYMAPEQATFNQLDIDTRADVYALGVLLYELLAGSPPVEPERLKLAALDEVLRIVREDEPPRPSQRLSTSQTKASIAAVRQTDPAKLTKLMRGEIDWIVMKALEKDRHRRYATADAIAADVQRYLAGEPVQAVPPSAAYRLRKFARKNRAMLTAVAAFAALLIVSAAVSGWLAVEARRAERRSEENRKVAVENERWANENAQRMLESWSAATQARREAERTANSLQVDLDLAEIASEPQVGLLRLCRNNSNMMHDSVELIVGNIMDAAAVYTQANRIMQLTAEQTDLTEEERALRESVTAAILIIGQEFAPLLPPITHDGRDVSRLWISPDHRTLLTLGNDFTARLWDTRMAKSVAVLRSGTERVDDCGYAPDGRTVFTHDITGVARFWDADGHLRTQTESRPNGYRCTISTHRFLTTSQVRQELADGGMKVRATGPVELWDTATGQVVARLDMPDSAAEKVEFLGDRWVTAVEARSTLLVYSGEDGQVIARLRHPAGEAIREWAVSPSGRRVATITEREMDKSLFVRMWSTDTWREQPVTMLLRSQYSWPELRVLTDDVFVGLWQFDLHSESGVYRFGQSEPLGWFYNLPESFPIIDDLVHVGDGRVFDSRNWQRLTPPAGRKLHPDLARFAPDGRLLYGAPGDPSHSQDGLIDVRTDKFIPTSDNWDWWDARLGNIPGFGLVSGGLFRDSALGLAAVVRLIPATDKLQIAPDLLELWAQVAVRGELDPNGSFVKWDKSTWEQKREELAAQSAPWPDFPFPGYVATDRLHWLRAEFANGADETAKATLAAELLKRAEAAGDNAEAVRWRAWLEAHAPQDGPPAE
jgi:tRNA A-37 threonylcarbamoyl transferase component Bud32